MTKPMNKKEYIKDMFSALKRNHKKVRRAYEDGEISFEELKVVVEMDQKITSILIDEMV